MNSEQMVSCECEHKEHEKREKIDFTVDQERLTAYSRGDAAELTVREVLDISGNQPPEDYELVELVGPHHHDQVKHTDLNEVLSVKKHAKFAALFKGCTPVS